MVELKSQVFSVVAPLAQVHAFLSQTENYQRILPVAQITEFACTPTQFSFKVAGQIQLTLAMKDHSQNTLYFVGAPNNPFAFELAIFLEENGEQTSGHIQINAELNMMLKMLVEKPLLKLLSQMAENLALELGAH